MSSIRLYSLSAAESDRRIMANTGWTECASSYRFVRLLILSICYCQKIRTCCQQASASSSRSLSCSINAQRSTTIRYSWQVHDFLARYAVFHSFIKSWTSFGPGLYSTSSNGRSGRLASSSFYEGLECWISIGEFDEPFCIDDENIVLGDVRAGPDDGDGRPNLVHDKEDFTMNII